LLRSHVAHDVKGAGKPIKRGCTTTGNIPMLSEEIERKDSINILSSNTLS
jgi:hypothetical protein